MFLKRNFGIFGTTMWEYANGIDNSKVIPHNEKDAKSISISETLETDISDKNKLKKILLHQSEKICRSLRKKEKYARSIGITLKNSKFYKYSKQTKLNNSVNSTIAVYQEVIKLFDSIYNGEKIRNIGIKLSDFTEQLETQLSLFDTNIQKKDQISPILDDIKDKYGDNIIILASLYNKDE